MNREILTSTVFERLRGELGDGFEQYFGDKVFGVDGDLTSERLGIDDDIYPTSRRKWISSSIAPQS